MPNVVSTQCLSCGAPVSGYSGHLVKCQYCGTDNVLRSEGTASLGINEKYCKYCGEVIHINAVVCPACGSQVEQVTAYGTAPVYIDTRTPEERQLHANQKLADATANSAIAALVAGMVLWFLSGLFGIIALVNGIKASRMGYKGAKSTVAIVLGIGQILLGIIMLVIFVITLIGFDWNSIVGV